MQIKNFEVTVVFQKNTEFNKKGARTQGNRISGDTFAKLIQIQDMGIYFEYIRNAEAIGNN